jgi:hypothetical protein
MADEDFHLGALVRSSDGREVGRLVHLLVGPSYELHSLVVKESSSFSGRRFAPSSLVLADEFIVPKDAATRVTHDGIELSLTAADVRRLPPYIGYREKGESASEFAEDSAGVLGSGPELPNWMEQIANKAADELEIDGGENVMLGHSGKKLGTVKDVLFEEGQLVGVVLLPEGWFKSEVILPRRFLQRSDDAALFVDINEGDLERLTRFRPSG